MTNTNDPPDAISRRVSERVEELREGSAYFRGDSLALFVAMVHGERWPMEEVKRVLFPGAES